MASLVANLLQFSRPEKEQYSSVDLGEEMNKTLELMHHHLRKRSIQTVFEVAPSNVRLYADRQKLRQVLLNLITNAGDAMPKGGTLTLRARQEKLDLQERQKIIIEIIDTGVGIPKDILPRVMDPFFTTKEEGKGTGLGLAICRRIVHEHHGTIEIESTPGMGTTVRISLPARNGANVTHLKSSENK
jgi:signal transduction histidine kinase